MSRRARSGIGVSGFIASRWMAAKAGLEAEAAEAAREQAQRRSRERGDDDDTTAAKGRAAADAATPKAKTQRNFTDPDSKIMLTGDGAFHQCYNARAVVDADHQVIVATNTGVAEFTATCGTEFFIATGRHRRDDPPPVAPRGRIPDGATDKQRMARKLATVNKGRAA